MDHITCKISQGLVIEKQQSLFC